MVKKGTIMIELNGIYKLKKLKGFPNNDTCEYQVLAFDDETNPQVAYCKNLKTNEIYCFWPQFIIDPEKPEETEIELIKIEK